MKLFGVYIYTIFFTFKLMPQYMYFVKNATAINPYVWVIGTRIFDFIHAFSFRHWCSLICYKEAILNLMSKRRKMFLDKGCWWKLFWIVFNVNWLIMLPWQISCTCQRMWYDENFRRLPFFAINVIYQRYFNCVFFHIKVKGSIICLSRVY